MAQIGKYDSLDQELWRRPAPILSFECGGTLNERCLANWFHA